MAGFLHGINAKVMGDGEIERNYYNVVTGP